MINAYFLRIIKNYVNFDYMYVFQVVCIFMLFVKTSAVSDESYFWVVDHVYGINDVNNREFVEKT